MKNFERSLASDFMDFHFNHIHSVRNICNPQRKRNAVVFSLLMHILWIYDKKFDPLDFVRRIENSSVEYCQVLDPLYGDLRYGEICYEFLKIHSKWIKIPFTIYRLIISFPSILKCMQCIITQNTFPLMPLLCMQCIVIFLE